MRHTLIRTRLTMTLCALPMMLSCSSDEPTPTETPQAPVVLWAQKPEEVGLSMGEIEKHVRGVLGDTLDYSVIKVKVTSPTPTTKALSMFLFRKGANVVTSKQVTVDEDGHVVAVDHAYAPPKYASAPAALAAQPKYVVIAPNPSDHPSVEGWTANVVFNTLIADSGLALGDVVYLIGSDGAKDPYLTTETQTSAPASLVPLATVSAANLATYAPYILPATTANVQAMLQSPNLVSVWYAGDGNVNYVVTSDAYLTWDDVAELSWDWNVTFLAAACNAFSTAPSLQGQPGFPGLQGPFAPAVFYGAKARNFMAGITETLDVCANAIAMYTFLSMFEDSAPLETAWKQALQQVIPSGDPNFCDLAFRRDSPNNWGYWGLASVGGDLTGSMAQMHTPTVESQVAPAFDIQGDYVLDNSTASLDPWNTSVAFATFDLDVTLPPGLSSLDVVAMTYESDQPFGPDMACAPAGTSFCTDFASRSPTSACPPPAKSNWGAFVNMNTPSLVTLPLADGSTAFKLSVGSADCPAQVSADSAVTNLRLLLAVPPQNDVNL